jgi:hypothetical protein
MDLRIATNDEELNYSALLLFLFLRETHSGLVPRWQAWIQCSNVLGHTELEEVC